MGGGPLHEEDRRRPDRLRPHQALVVAERRPDGRGANSRHPALWQDAGLAVSTRPLPGWIAELPGKAALRWGSAWVRCRSSVRPGWSSGTSRPEVDSPSTWGAA